MTKAPVGVLYYFYINSINSFLESRYAIRKRIKGVVLMDADRAAEIFNSLGIIEVYHQGAPVWIEKVDSNRIQVQNLNTDQRFEVSPDDLVEGLYSL